MQVAISKLITIFKDLYSDITYTSNGLPDDSAAVRVGAGLEM